MTVGRRSLLTASLALPFASAAARAAWTRPAGLTPDASIALWPEGHIAPPAGLVPRPVEESDDASRRARLVPVVEMVGGWIVEIDRLFHQAQAQQSGIEIDVPLRIAGDGGDVVDTGDFPFHRRQINRRGRSREMPSCWTQHARRA